MIKEWAAKVMSWARKMGEKTAGRAVGGEVKAVGFSESGDRGGKGGRSFHPPPLTWTNHGWEARTE
jgi:hypothetical protein